MIINLTKNFTHPLAHTTSIQWGRLKLQYLDISSVKDETEASVALFTKPFIENNNKRIWSALVIKSTTSHIIYLLSVIVSYCEATEPTGIFVIFVQLRYIFLVSSLGVRDFN